MQKKKSAVVDIYKDMQTCTKHKQGEMLVPLFHLIFVAFKITVNYSLVECSDGVIASEG